MKKYNLLKITLLTAVILTLITGCTSIKKQDKWAWAYAESEKIVPQLTLDEKCGLMAMNAKPVKRFNIPEHYWWSEALHGVARNGKATQFPQAICLASTWDPKLLKQISTAISDEACAKFYANSAKNVNKYQGLTIWSPTINMARDPRWGRTEETYGEDPYLAGQMAVAFVTGLQGNNPKWLKTVATVKHFVANNSEYNRESSSYPVPMRDLRDYYFPAFRTAVEKGDAASIMTAYNGINGIPCSVNKWLVTDILKNTWHFNGAVVTDAGAGTLIKKAHHYTKSNAKSVALMIKAGVNVFSDDNFGNYIKTAIKQGLITEKEVNNALIPNLAVRIKLGQLENLANIPYSKIPTSVVGCEQHRKLAQQAAEEGIVLLKNSPASDGEKVLPLDKNRVKNIILCGPYANVAQIGTYSGTPATKPISPYNGIVKRAGDKFNVKLILLRTKNIPIAKNFFSPELNSDIQGLKAEYYDNIQFKGSPKKVRIDNAINFNWYKPQINNIDPDVPQPIFAVRWTGFITPETTGVYLFNAYADDGVRVWINGKKCFEDWSANAYRNAGSKSMHLEAGKHYPVKVEYYDVGGDARVTLNWALPTQSQDPFKGFSPQNTMIVYVCGSSGSMENEGHDRKNIQLRDFEKQVIKKLVERFPMTTVVFNGGSSLSDLWAAKYAPVILDAWYPGQEGGTALANIIFGDVNPSGRLPITFYKSIKQLPPLGDYAVAGNNRTYMYFKGEPIWVFGHGLSYTKFDYTKTKTDKTEIRAEDTVNMTLAVKNSGARDGDEIVQIYLKQLKGDQYTPIRKLISFKRVNIKAGETAEITIPLKVKEWKQWSEKANNFILSPGKYELQIGSSSKDIREKIDLTVK